MHSPYTIFGRSLTFAGNHEAAIAENRLSIELNPNLALAHYGLRGITLVRARGSLVSPP